MKIIKTIVLAIALISTSFAQQITSEELLILNDSIQLPGTLTYDKDLKTQPLVIFIHGSGNVDRNGNQRGMNASASYIEQLSKALNNNKIAFYRYDKRTATLGNMKFLIQGVTFDSFVEDAKLAIDRFKDDSRFSSLILIGHSQGSLVGMLASQQNAHVDKYISLAGPADAIDVTITNQVRTQNGDSIADMVSAHFKELKTKGSIETVNPNLMSIFNKSMQPFFASWMQYTPTDEIKNLNVPILILNGTKDIQVPTEDAKALHKANPKSKLVLVEDMNHVLKSISKDEDNLKSYRTPDFPLSEQLVSTVTTFIKQ